MRLVLIRHAETLWNREGRLQGTADSPLTSEGSEQARHLGPAMSSLAIEHALTSDLSRARATAELAGLGSATPDSAWREADLGDWTGQLVTDIPDEAFRAWRRGELSPPNGEGHDQVRERVADALARLDGHNTAVVTHGGTIRAVLDVWLGLAPTMLGPATPGSITVLERTSRVRLMAYNLGPSLLADVRELA